MTWVLWRRLVCAVAVSAAPVLSWGQIDPTPRQLLQLGYDQPLQGRGPVAGYAFYYLNRPHFLESNYTLRLAVAPVYFDTELGIKAVFGENTDLGVGLFGGGFSESHNEVRQGRFLRDETFDGHGGGTALSLYHRFNPEQMIPLSGMLRVGGKYSTYSRDHNTSKRFELPDDRKTLNLRTGLRLGGKEPTLFPSLAMELSAWYEGFFRDDSEVYGFNDDRKLESASHLGYLNAALDYTLPNRRDNFGISLTAGASASADRFTAYRLGGVLPLVAEYPLIIPGYYFQEISAKRFWLLNGRYLLPLDKDKHWHLTLIGSVALVDYLETFEQPGHWHSGVGGGITYKSTSELWKISLSYGYGFEALRNGDRGAHNLGFYLQYDIERHLTKRRQLREFQEKVERGQ